MSSSGVLWMQVWGLALVQGAIALTWVIYNLYLVALLTQFGFPAALATGLLVLENILAAFIEPAMGSFSDDLQHRMGTRFPFIALGMILSSALFIGIPVVLIFGSPVQLTRWLLPTVLVAWAIAMTLFRSPALSLLGRYAFRTQLPQAASILTLVGGVAGALAPLAGNAILGMGPMFAFAIGSFTLIGAAFALRAVGPNQSVAAVEEELVEGDRSSSIPSQSLSIARLALAFGAGAGVALGFRLLMQMFPMVLSTQVPNANTGLVLGSIFIALALTAVPAGVLATRLGTRRAMALGLVTMALLSLVALGGRSVVLAFGVAIAVGMAFSLVSNTTIPFALSMVPARRAGLGTGMYFSGAAVAMSGYGMVISQEMTVSPLVGLAVGAIAFLGAAVCVIASVKL
jgi:Na+/melibiose symporter-like transporter